MTGYFSLFGWGVTTWSPISNSIYISFFVGHTQLTSHPYSSLSLFLYTSYILHLRLHPPIQLLLLTDNASALAPFEPIFFSFFLSSSRISGKKRKSSSPYNWQHCSSSRSMIWEISMKKKNVGAEKWKRSQQLRVATILFFIFLSCFCFSSFSCIFFSILYSVSFDIIWFSFLNSFLFLFCF